MNSFWWKNKMDRLILTQKDVHDYDYAELSGLKISIIHNGTVCFDTFTFAFCTSVNCPKCEKYQNNVDFSKHNVYTFHCVGCNYTWQLELDQNDRVKRDEALAHLRAAYTSIQEARKLWRWHKIGT
jgi:Zn ribbon nucleic-acid-binding protein